MDPDANLADQEWTLKELSRHHDETIADQEKRLRQQRRELSELRQALYDWIRDGGFEPDWTKAPLARQHYGR